MDTFNSTFGVAEFINFGTGATSFEDNSITLHGNDGDSYVGGTLSDTVTVFSANASKDSAKTRINTGAGNDSLFIGSGNFGVSLGSGDDILTAGNGSGSSFTDTFLGAGSDRVTLGANGDHDMLVRDFNYLEDKWGFRTASEISVCFSNTVISGVNVIEASFGENSFYFSAASVTVEQLQASSLNTLV